MSKIVLVANMISELEYYKGNDYIGVDKGSLYCMEHQIPMICAIGDFDSITHDQYIQLSNITNTIKLCAEKDETDSEYALRYAKDLNYSEIEIVGIIGGRQDHFLTIYHFLRTSNINFKMRDASNLIYRLDKGSYAILKKSKYLSIFACESLTISISGVKYPLIEKKVDEGSTFLVSNEIVGENAKLTISGRIIVIESEVEN